MGVAVVSVSDGGRVSRLRHLLAGVGFCAADDQQRVFGADLYSHFSDSAANFFRERWGGRGVYLGTASLRYVRVHAVGVGEQLFGVPDGPDFLVDADHAGARRAET